MIYTSRFSNPELKTGKYTAIRISVGSPRWNIGYQIAGSISELMPKGIYGKYDNDKAAYEAAYRGRLDYFGVQHIRQLLAACEQPDKDIVLLCYEDVRKGESDWCHRTMFAKWWFEKTGEVIPELPDPSTPKISKPKMKAAVEQTTLF